MIDEKKLIKDLDAASDAGCIRRINDVIDIIKQQPRADGWVPVTEMLPKENGNYLVTVRSYDDTANIDFICVGHYNAANAGSWTNHNKSGRKRGSYIIAWMYLPEKYSEAEI